MQITEKITISTSKLIVKIFDKLGIDTVFGYPGHSVLPLYNELALQKHIKHYLLRHEQSAVHAAEGYAKAGGKCSVVVVTAGPGASNTITGIINAYFDGTPVIIISGQINASLQGKDSFQEINFSQMVKPYTKASFKIETAEEVESTLLESFLIATSGKKGPVVIEISKNILESQTEYKNLSLPADKSLKLSNVDVIHTFELIKSAKFPVIISGGGVVQAGASSELTELADRLQIPIVSTMMGIGAFPQHNPLYAGMVGIYGDESANQIVKDADLLIVLGARINDRIAAAFDKGLIDSKTIIQVDINGKELLRNLKSDIALHADVKDFLTALNSFISESGENNLSFSRFIPRRMDEDEEIETLTVKKVVKILSDYTQKSSYFVSTDVGQHQIALIKNYQFNRAGQLLTSGGFGTMGFGLPAAIGASLVSGGEPVILVTGDGSFQMSVQELAACSEYNIPVKIMVMNNGYLGMVRQLQEEQYDGRYFETEIKNPDFVMLAKSYGIDAVRVKDVSEVKPALAKAFEQNKPFLIDFVTEPFENV